MIEGYIEPIFEKLNKSDVHLYPTGSRYFGRYSGTSDTDYFTQYTLGVEAKLKSFGFFSSRDGSTYSDGYCVKVLAYNGQPKVHIQLVREAERRWKVHQWIKTSDTAMALYSSLSKTQERDFWNTLFQLNKLKSQTSEVIAALDGDLVW